MPTRVAAGHPPQEFTDGLDSLSKLAIIQGIDAPIIDNEVGEDELVGIKQEWGDA